MQLFPLTGALPARNARRCRPLLSFFARNAALAVTACVAAACATTEPSPLSGSDAHTSVSLETPAGTTDTNIRRVDYVGVAIVPARRQAVWQNLREVWADIGLTEPQVDARAFTLVISERVFLRRLGRTPLSIYLSCGNSLAGPNADSHQIRMSVRTLLEHVSADSTRVHTRLDAVAHSTGGVSTAAIQCTSKGTLESLIAQRIREKVAQSPSP